MIPIAPKIIFQDADVLVVHKPPRLHSVKQAKSKHPSLAEALEQFDPTLVNASEKEEDAGLIHRLDYSTEGLLLVGRNRQSWQSLRDQLLRGTITKMYMALVEGLMDENLEVENFIGSPHRGAKKVRIFDRPRKKDRALPAHTEFHSRRIDRKSNTTLVEAIAPTARRHQIRAHAAHAGHALVGDALYGSSRKLQDIHPEAIAEFFLLAWKIEFAHPRSGKTLRFETEAPAWI